jgi:prepilin-type N-terminal cleavage/methylation domain-containing protein
MHVHLLPVRPDAEGGFTLVELLVTLTIMSIAFVTIISGIGVFSQTTRMHRSTAQLDAATRTYAERLVSASYDATCPTSYTAVAIPAGYVAGISVQYWDGNASPVGWVASCPATDKGIQRLTVSLTQTTSGARDQLVLVKRQP